MTSPDTTVASNGSRFFTWTEESLESLSCAFGYLSFRALPHERVVRVLFYTARSEEVFAGRGRRPRF